MASRRNPAWKLYGTKSKIPHGLGRELLLLHGLPEKGYPAARRKQLNRLWGRLYQQMALTDEGELDNRHIEALLYDFGDDINFADDQKLQYEVGRSIARALINGGAPMLAYDPLTGDAYLYDDASKVKAVACDELEDEEYDILMDLGTITLPSKSVYSHKLNEIVIPLDTERCVAVNEGEIGNGFDLWAVRYLFVPLYTSKYTLREIPELDSIVQEMLELASTPWEKKIFGTWKTGGISGIDPEEIDTFFEKYGDDHMYAKGIMDMLKSRGYDVWSVDFSGDEPVFRGTDNKTIPGLDFDELTQEAIDEGFIDLEKIALDREAAYEHMMRLTKRGQRQRQKAI